MGVVVIADSSARGPNSGIGARRQVPTPSHSHLSPSIQSEETPHLNIYRVDRALERKLKTPAPSWGYLYKTRRNRPPSVKSTRCSRCPWNFPRPPREGDTTRPTSPNLPRAARYQRGPIFISSSPDLSCRSSLTKDKSEQNVRSELGDYQILRLRITSLSSRTCLHRTPSTPT